MMYINYSTLYSGIFIGRNIRIKARITAQFKFVICVTGCLNHGNGYWSLILRTRKRSTFHDMNAKE